MIFPSCERKNEIQRQIGQKINCRAEHDKIPVPVPCQHKDTDLYHNSQRCRQYQSDIRLSPPSDASDYEDHYDDEHGNDQCYRERTAAGRAEERVCDISKHELPQTAHQYYHEGEDQKSFTHFVFLLFPGFRLNSISPLFRQGNR